MANTTHKVQAGETLSSIAKKYGTTWQKLAELNDLPDANYIVVDQVLIIDGNKAEKTTVLTAPKIDIFGLQTGTTRTIYAAWPSWTQADTDHYEVRWYYDTGDAIGWIRDVNSTVDNRQSIYGGAPDNALRVRFVMRPVAKIGEDEEEPPWTAPWSTEKIYVFAENPPSAPTTPSDIVIDRNCQMTITIDNINVGKVDYIDFQIAKIARDDDSHSEIYHTGHAEINIAVNSVTYRCRVDAGCLYKVRCRSVRGTITSDWSAFSNTVGAIPIAPGKITDCVTKSEDSVYLKWTKVASAVSYNVQHTTNEEYFDLATSGVETESGITSNECIITGLEKGVTHYFRVQAVNEDGDSGWSTIASTKVGSKPTTPTTWSSKSTAVIGDIIRLSWSHNVEDGSDQTGYKIELDIDGIITIESDQDTASNEFYDLDTNEYLNDDATITWKVKTKGVTGEYCDDWSVARTIKVYVKPSVALSVTDVKGTLIDRLTSFPFYISGTSFPSTQKPIGYHVNITSNQEYDTVDNLGKEVYVNPGDSVYSKFVDNPTSFREEISAENVTLENNMSYTITVVVSLDSGLTAENSYEFQIAWTTEQYVPNAIVRIDKDTLTASIHPYCVDNTNNQVTDAYVSVYRRDFDGRFTEIDSNIDCAKYTYVTDPHPALDYARYRIIAKSKSTGTICYYDMPGIKVGEKAAVIQWDEKWSSFESMTEMESSTPPWSGSLLKLPYNLDISDKYQQDVQHVEYIGREHPVSYHGTQTGETSIWNVEVPKTDTETLYTLRRLSIWRGNVYVREPSGSGYWATVLVSLNKKHKALTIPVTINVTRVEGGV